MLNLNEMVCALLIYGVISELPKFAIPDINAHDPVVT